MAKWKGVKNQKTVEKKYNTIKIFFNIFIVIIFIVTTLLLISSNRSNSTEYIWNKYYRVTFDENWTKNEIISWKSLLNNVLPEIEKELGKPPKPIYVRLKKGYINNDSQQNLHGFDYSKYLQDKTLYCTSPMQSASICLHEIVHTFFVYHIPENQFFSEGIAVYLQKTIGDRININHNNDVRCPEYYYHMEDSFQSLDRFELASYGSYELAIIANSGIYPIQEIQYGLKGYFWKKLIEKDPDILKKISAGLWKINNSNGIVSNNECQKIAEKEMINFKAWYQERKSLNPNIIDGLRLVVGCWPKKDDLIILFWNAVPDKVTMLNDKLIDANAIKIEIFHKNRKLVERYTAMRDSCIILPGFIGEMKKYVPTPFTIKIQTGGSPNLTDKIEIK